MSNEKNLLHLILNKPLKARWITWKMKRYKIENTAFFLFCFGDASLFTGHTGAENRPEKTTQKEWGWVIITIVGL